MDVISIMAGAAYSGLEQALLYGLLTLGAYFSFKVVRFPDLTVDGSFVLGAAVAAVFAVHVGHPWLGSIIAFAAGCAAGAATATLHIRLGINRLLCGILVMTMLYTINLRLMGRPNIPLVNVQTVLSWVEGLPSSRVWVPLFLAAILATWYLAADLLLRTEVGLYLQATGQKAKLVTRMGKSAGSFLLLGMALSNGLVAVSGALVSQRYGFVDVNMGIGMVVMALASLFIGDGLVRGRSTRCALVAAFVGTIVYHVLRNVGLRMGLAPTDLKLVTAALVIAALVISPRSRTVLEERPLV